MKEQYIQLVRLVSRIIIIHLLGFSGYMASGQNFEVTAIDPATGPYYPYDSLSIDYENTTSTPDSVVYYLAIDTDADGELDNGDHILAQGESDAGTLAGRLPYLPDTSYPFLVFAGSGGVIGEDITTETIDESTLIFQGESTTTYPLEMTEGNTARQILISEYEFSEGNHYALIIDLNTTFVTIYRDVIVQYSTNAGLDYQRLATIDGRDTWRGVSGTYVLPIPDGAITDNTYIRIIQPNSVLSTELEDQWSVSSIQIQSSDETFIQYKSATYGNVYISEPDILVSDPVRDDTVGRSFSVAYDARGFLEGATYYYYSGDIYDPADRIIYDQDTELTGVFNGQWPFEEADAIDGELRLAAINGNIDEPTVHFNQSQISTNGTNQTAFPYTFNQNLSRNFRTGPVDIAGEENASIEIRFGTVNTLGLSQRINLEYSLDGTSWVVLDSIYGSSLSASTYRYDLEGEMLSASTRFRLRQTGEALGTNYSWQINGIEVDQYDEQLNKIESTSTLQNFEVKILEVFDDAGEPVTVGYPGDELTVETVVHGFDISSRNFTLVLGDKYIFDNVTQSINGDTVLITGAIPLDASYEEMSLQVLIYDDSAPRLGLNKIIFSDYAEEDLTIVNGDYKSNRADFAAAGSRIFETPSMTITASEDLALAFDLRRINSVRSPAGTEISLEFSTDGSSFTELGTYSINETGTTGTSYEVTDFPAEVVSSSTSFRFRQLTNNGVDLDAWSISNITVVGGSSIYRRDYLEYDAVDITITSPVLTLGSVNSSGADLYPGATFTNSLQLTGSFPTGTTFSLYMERESGYSINLNERTNVGDFSAEVPSVLPGNYNLVVKSDFGDIESNTIVLAVLAVDINDIAIGSDDAVVDGSNSIVYPTNTIDVSYGTVGTISSNATATLEVFDHTSHVDDYVTLVSGEAVDGSISAALPIGIDYDGDPQLRLTIVNGNLEYVNEVINEDWGAFVEQYRIETSYDSELDEYVEYTIEYTSYSEKYFPADSRSGHAGSNVYSQAGIRMAQSNAMDLSEGPTNIKFDLSVSSYTGNQWLYLQYTTDDETWISFDSVLLTSSNQADLFPDFIALPEASLSASTKLRFFYNDDEVAGDGVNALYFSGFSLSTLQLEPVASETFDLSVDLSFENLSLSVSDLGRPTYKLGESFNVEYNTDGPFASNIGFAVVLNGLGDLSTGTSLVIGESSSTGAVVVSGSAPLDPDQLESLEENHSSFFGLSVVPFAKSGLDTVYRAATKTTILDGDEDFVLVSGSDEDEVPFSFDQTGDRFLLTDTLDLSAIDSATLSFNFTYTGGIPRSLRVLPFVQITNDGENFTTLAIDTDQSDYSDEGYLFNSGSYSITIPSSLSTASTQFRWYQELNRGADQNAWSISNVAITEGATNAFNSFVYGPNSDQTIEIIEPDINNFVWEQADMTDAVFNGETFDYSWNFDDSEIDFNSFPDGTQFVFTLADVLDPSTNEALVLATTTSMGAGAITLPLYVDSGTYQVKLTASKEATDAAGDAYTVFFYEDVDIPDGNLEVFNRVVTTAYSGTTSPVYAGSTATFSIDLENDETNSLSIEDLYATLLVLDFEGSDDLILFTQQGSADMVVDLPAYLRGGDFEFEVQFSEGQPLGSIGDLGAFDFDSRDDDIMNISADASNIISGKVGPEAIETRNFASSEFVHVLSEIEELVSEVSSERVISFRVDFSSAKGESLQMEYAFNDEAYTLFSDLGNADRVGELISYNFPTEIIDDPSTYEQVKFRWLVGSGDMDGSMLTISNLTITDIGANLENSGGLTTSNKMGSELSFTNDYGRGLITTRDFLSAELASVSLLSFDLTFGESFEKVKTDEQLILEYSSNEGATYTSLQTFPMANSEALSEESMNVTITDEMRTDTVRFRFRQEERAGIEVVVHDLSFVNSTAIPFDYISETINVVNQSVMVTGFDARESCVDDTIALDYNIRGRLGADTRMKLQVIGESIGTKTLNQSYAITEGSGSISFGFPSELLSIGANNEELNFRLTYEDNSRLGFEYSGFGVVSEESVELIAPINQAADFTWDDPLECSPGNVTLSLSGAQHYFRYEAINEADGSVLGSVTYEPTGDSPEINIGSITSDVNVSLRVTAMSSTGRTCDIMAMVEQKDIEVLSTYKLHRRGYNDLTQKIQVNPGDSRLICGSSSEVRLSVNRDSESADGSSSIAEWFRNDLSTPVTVLGDVLGDNEQLQSGAYFARITETTGSGNVCAYLTESFSLTRVETPERPVVTVESGSLSFCEGEGQVVLLAPSGFAYYKWNGNNQWTNRRLSVTENGSYSVEVSNVPFDAGCGSASSVPVVVESQYLPDFKVKWANFSDDQYNIVEGSSYAACDQFTVYFYDGSVNQNNNGEVVINRDGVFYASTQDASFTLEESGDYTVEWISSDLNSSCTASVGSFILEITVKPATPSITTTGSLSFCEGGSVTLNATAGYNYYRWYRNGSVLSSSAENLTVRTNSGRYQVEASNVPFNVGCVSDKSAGVNVTVYNAPDMSISSNYLGELYDGQVLDVCSANEDHYLQSYNSYGNPVTWFLDGIEVPGGDGSSGNTSYAYIYPTQSGAYYAEVTVGGTDVSSQCSFTTETVTVNYVDQPVPVSIALPSQTSFCEDAVSVTLTADSGSPFYRWYRNGTPITDGTGSNNTLQVSQAGNYTVTVANAKGCESEMSNTVIIEEQALPVTTLSLSVEATDCASGDVTVAVGSTNSKYSYQLTSRETGEDIGAVFTGNSFGNVFITLSNIETTTQLGVEVTYADGTGCTNESDFVGTVVPNSVVLEMDGNTLIAVISGDYLDYSWYRNGVELRNANTTSLTITDAATYTIEVQFEGGCVLTSNAVDLGSGDGRSTASASNGRMVANTYPNPSVNRVSIEIPGLNMGTYKVQIMTLSGQIVVTEVFNKQKESFIQSIDISSLDRGIYNMSVLKGKNVEHIRIVKQ